MVSPRPPPLYPARTEGRKNYIKSTFHPFNEGHQKACPDKSSAPTKHSPSPPHHKGKDWHLPEETSIRSHLGPPTEPGSGHRPWPCLGTLLGWQQVHLAPLLPLWSAPLSVQVLATRLCTPLCFSSSLMNPSRMDPAGISSNTHILAHGHFCKILL